MGKSDQHLYAACLVFAIAWTEIASALSPDTRILSLIPRNVEIVDGSGASPAKAGVMSFLVFRTENAVDLRDFRGLLGVDASKTIRQIFLVGGTERPSPRFEHSVISLGRFNQSRIFEAAIQNGGRTRAYRGIKILEVDPFTRNQGTINEVRWLAVIAPDLVVFGTVGHVREEVDRYVDHSLPNSSLLERFGRLRRDDETWCLFSKTVQKDGIRRALGSLDIRFVDLARDDTQFQFGIHFGARIRLDYESGISNSDPPATESQTAIQSPTDIKMQSSATVGIASVEKHPVSGEISLARTRYEKWLGGLLNVESGLRYPSLGYQSR